MKNSIILLVKECIAAHACIQTENGNVIGLFLDYLAVDHIVDDIANGIGDVAEWKARAEKAEQEVSALNERAKRFKIVVPMGTTVNSFGSELYRTQPNPYSVKQLYSDEEVEDIARQRDEYKHRTEVAEEERDKAQKSLVALCNEVAKIAIASDLVAIDNNTHKFFECKSDWSGTCKKCYFACENYPFDMGRCEHNQYHWLNHQAEREIEEEKGE